MKILVLTQMFKVQSFFQLFLPINGMDEKNHKTYQKNSL
jgi:hypothetical protein